MEQAGRQLEEYSEEIKARITEMALIIAEKILQREVGAGAEGLADLVEQAVMSERDKNEITVHYRTTPSLWWRNWRDVWNH